MNEITLAQESLQLARKDLILEDNLTLEGVPDPFERLHAFLEKQVSWLLDHDFSRLIHALYRIDIPESEVNRLLSESPPGQVAANISAAIIHREKQKVISRQKYRQT